MPYFFNLPLITELTKPQQSALDEPEPVAVLGGPGTGKSVVSLWRHIRNHSIGKKRSLLLTYTKTLKVYLAQAGSTENDQAGENVDRVLRWLEHGPETYDEIIIDEAQDITASTHEEVKQYATSICYGADEGQILYPSSATTEAELAKLYPNNEEYLLDRNFRNSYEILLFVKALFPNRNVPDSLLKDLLANNKRGGKPQVIITGDDNAKEQAAILEIIGRLGSEVHNIAILVPLKAHVRYYYDLLIKAGVACTNYESDKGALHEIGNVHVTTFKSSKGVEFDTVILPDFHLMKSNIAKLDVVKENDYFVALTRAKRNLFLICEYDTKSLNQNDAQTNTYTKEIRK